jgi:hypothetical protein
MEKKTQKLKIYKEKHKNNIKTHRLKKKPASNKIKDKDHTDVKFLKLLKK